MPLIPIEPSTFERLQSHARPLVDTVDSVINRGLDALKNLGTQPAPIVNGQANKRIIDPRFLPSLTHTKVLDAVIDGESLSKTNWSAVRNDMLQRGMKHFGSFEKLRKVCPINIVQGKKEDEGYSYLSDIDISVQGPGFQRGVPWHHHACAKPKDSTRHYVHMASERQSCLPRRARSIDHSWATKVGHGDNSYWSGTDNYERPPQNECTSWSCNKWCTRRVPN